MCAAGEHHYGGLHVTAPLQQVQQLAFGLFEAGGATSAASIEGVTSSRTTNGSLRLMLGCSKRCQLGPSSAMTASSQASPSTSGQATVAQPAAGQQAA